MTMRYLLCLLIAAAAATAHAQYEIDWIFETSETAPFATVHHPLDEREAVSSDDGATQSAFDPSSIPASQQFVGSGAVTVGPDKVFTFVLQESDDDNTPVDPTKEWIVKFWTAAGEARGRARVVPQYNSSTNVTLEDDAITAAKIAAGAITASEAPNLDAQVSTRMATFTLPTNFDSLVISGSGAVDSLQQGVLNTPFTEATAGRLAGNQSVFWGNADALTTNVVDDTGSGGGGLTKADVRDALFVDAFDLVANTSDGSAFGRMLDDDTDGSFDWVQATDGFKAIRDRGDAAWTGGGGTTVDASTVNPKRTWSITEDGAGHQAPQFVTVQDEIDVTYQFDFANNVEATITGTPTVVITGPEAVTVTNIRLRASDQKAVLFDTSPINTTGTYTVKVTVSTTDSQTIPAEGTLIVK